MTKRSHHEDEFINLAKALFPHWKDLPSIADLEERFPLRGLPPNAFVTRVAPSPTGFAHIGIVYVSLINRNLAKHSGGTFILRIEDTDTKREVKGAVDTIVNALNTYGLTPDEGVKSEDESFGSYGPYYQSQRKNIYQSIAFDLVRRGKAYPCFCSDKDLKALSETQMRLNVRTGYYGEWARCRTLSTDEILDKINKNHSYVIRLRSAGSSQSVISWDDGIKSKITMPENILDAILLKSNGHSLYHLAHIVDDRFMRVTHVIRGDEWLGSMPLHLQLYDALGWTPPAFSHLSPIEKIEHISEKLPDGRDILRESRRKLSKRKDPEASVHYYREKGYPKEAVVEYLLNIANSNFEEWRRSHIDIGTDEFAIDVDKLNISGALFDEVKLAHISREVLARMKSDQIYEEAREWLKEFDSEFLALFTSDRSLVEAALNIERGDKKNAKRLETWKDLKPQLLMFFDGEFEKLSPLPFPGNISVDDRRAILKEYLERIDLSVSREVWFDTIKTLAGELGYATAKELKTNPSLFKGVVGDVAMVIRVAVCGSRQSPDLYEVMRVLGNVKVEARLRRAVTKQN